MEDSGRELETGVPDLRGIPLDRIAGLGGTVLANAIAEYRKRLAGNGLPLSSFSARI
jgi:FXSXX-COOH protein